MLDLKALSFSIEKILIIIAPNNNEIICTYLSGTLIKLVKITKTIKTKVKSCAKNNK